MKKVLFSFILSSISIFTACSFVTNFFIINTTDSVIQLEITISKSENISYAIHDTVYFYSLAAENDNNNIQLGDKLANETVYKELLEGVKKIKFDLPPKSAIRTDGGAHNSFFWEIKNRKSKFNNIINMRIISRSFNDTIDLKPFHLSSFSKRFDDKHLALIFE